MNKVLVSSLALLSALAVFDVAKADEPPAKPKRERAAAAPARAAPAQQQASNWSGGQVGGSKRRQLREQRLRRARRLCLPVRQQHRQQLLRDPVFVQRAQGRLHHRSVRRLRFSGGMGARYRRRLVLQEQRELFEPASTAAIAVTGSNYAANRPVLGLRQAEIGFIDPGARGHARHALEPAIRDRRRRVRRNQRGRSRMPEASTFARAAPREAACVSSFD